MQITVPEFALVVLIGASGSGKSTFARQHFLPTEVISSDFCRGLVSDDENSQSATPDAFDVLHYIAAKRLAGMKLTVIDATNVQREARARLLELARQYHALPIAIVLNLPERICIERNQQRPDRTFGPQVVLRQSRDLHHSLRWLEKEGFRRVFVLKSEAEVAAATLVRERMWTDRKDELGPFDIIGDVHGCFDELVLLLNRLGYHTGEQVYHPAGRKVILLGDLVDRGPQIPQVLRLAMGMVQAGTALCVPGNHDVKLLRALRGKQVQVRHGLAASLEQLNAEAPEFRQQVIGFLDSLVSHYMLDGGRLIVAHAGMKESMAGRASGAVREFALYGETTGETDEFGLPVRYNWAAEYRGRATVIYGHTPVPEPQWLNNTINIDTGCVFGGALSALRYPEKELVSVPALHTYVESARPLLTQVQPAAALSLQQAHDDVLAITDVIGKRVINTRLAPNILIREENAAAALEVMSRFAVHPKWLIYLPPTMSPTETSKLTNYLEHPAEAFAYYRDNSVQQVICEEKHMGSRAIVVVCRDEEIARKRFGLVGTGPGVCYTRTGRPFFNDQALESAFLARIQQAVSAAGLWAELASDWLLLDCELMPWSAKAQALLQTQYAAVGAAGRAALQVATAALQQSAGRIPEAQTLLERYRNRAEMVDQYVTAYRAYCWPVHSLQDLKLAPFHLLASESAVHTDKNHLWHMEMAARVCAVDAELFQATAHQVVEVTEEASQATAVQWWEDLTTRGGEGMVVKPLEFLAKGQRGLLQPAIKCRGREYLRIIYGPEYTASEQIDLLRRRSLRHKRGLAIAEFALGSEALERFVRYEPLRRVHECVFGVLALESEPVDPRL